MKHYWRAPELWPGATFVCVAGGPSLTAAQVDACRDRVDSSGNQVRVIVINDGYRIAPWADVLYFCDDKWWGWHHEKLKGWKGLIVRLDGGRHDFGDPRIKVMKNYGREGLCTLTDGLMHGRNSGYQAIGLAAHLGARRILLLGYDMRAGEEKGKPKLHWFGDHPGGTSPRVFEQMVPCFDGLVKPLAERGIEILNCTPRSALKAFPFMDLAAALPAARVAA